jgi:outer membrane protein OmpA-like peptidoglycan-associated protein
MKHWIVVAALAATGTSPAFAQADAEGCKDHPLFNRMSSYRIEGCDGKAFDAMAFMTRAGSTCEAPEQTVEGRTYYYDYRLKEGATSASALQVQRNFANAVRAAGGTVVAEGGAGNANGALCHDGSTRDRAALFRMAKGASETWALVVPFDAGAGYELFIVERQAMKQEIAANELLDRMNRDGVVSLQVHFDTGKATIRPESQAQIDEAATMMKQSSSLRVEIGGHTDNAGAADANLKRSDSRARSVLQALVQRGVGADRMTAKGYGQAVPVADNRTEEGRARNRRVELVRR